MSNPFPDRDDKKKRRFQQDPSPAPKPQLERETDLRRFSSRIASGKPRGSTRSVSPLKTNGPSFGGITQAPQQQQAPLPGANFTFGSGQQNGVSFGQTPSTGNGYNFGQTQPPPGSNFSFAQPQATPASNDFTFGQSQSQSQPANNGFNFAQTQPAPASKFTFGQDQQQQQQAPQSNGFSFGASQQAPSSPFAFSQTQQPASPSTSGFTFGQQSQSQSQSTAPSSFTFGQTQPSSQSSAVSPSPPAFSFPPTNGTSNPFASLGGANNVMQNGGQDNSAQNGGHTQNNGAVNPFASLIGRNNNSQSDGQQHNPGTDPSTDTLIGQSEDEGHNVQHQDQFTSQAPAQTTTFSSSPANFNFSDTTSNTNATSNPFANLPKPKIDTVSAPDFNMINERPQDPQSTSIFTPPQSRNAEQPINQSSFKPLFTTQPTPAQEKVAAPSAPAPRRAEPSVAQPLVSKTNSTQSSLPKDQRTAPTIAALNTALLQHLHSSVDADQDWSPLMQYYLNECARIKSNPSQASNKRKASEERINTSPEKKTKGDLASRIEFPASPKPLSQTASIMNNILESPEKTPVTVATTTPTATSSTSIFQSTPTKTPAPALFNFSKPATAPESTGSTSAPLFSLQKPAESPAKTDNSSKPGFQMPKFGGNTSGTTPAASSAPKFGGGSAGNVNFLSAFGAQAEKQAEKDKKKRKAEDFDSDEDDETEWEKQDREKQEAKRQKLLAQSKKVLKNVDGQFVYVDPEEPDNGKEDASQSQSQTSVPTEAAVSPAKPSTVSSGPSNPFSSFAQPQAQAPSPAPTLTKSLFSTTPAATPAKSGGFKFGSAADYSYDEDKSPPPEESTTPEASPAKPAFFASNATPKFSFADSSKANATPKFSFSDASMANAAPTSEIRPFANLFGPKSNATPAGSAAPSIFSATSTTSGFGFGGPGSLNAGSSALSSAGVSRATTPGATTDAEGSTAATDNEEEEAASPEPQKDLTALTAEETRSEDVLFEQKARCRRYNRGADEPWENKGVGIMRLFKNKQSGNPRIVMRQTPSGALLINSNLMKQKDVYVNMGDKTVKLLFAESTGGVATYTASFGSADKAQELLGAIKAAIDAQA